MSVIRTSFRALYIYIYNARNDVLVTLTFFEITKEKRILHDVEEIV
jgi:hypothetical protein